MTTFDPLAGHYDTIAESDLGRALRRRVHDVVEPWLSNDAVVLDLGCGTGIDAAWFAQRVRHVYAVDRSAEMVRLTAERTEGMAVTTAEVNLDEFDGFSGIDALPGFEPGAPVDLALVNFGVINCLDDLAGFGAALAQVLHPDGVAVVVTMPRWCPIEIVVGAATANRSLVMRRLGSGDPEGPYGDLSVQYASAATLADQFGEHLSLVRAESLGVVLPPFEQRQLVQGRPTLLSALATVDRTIGPVAARLGLGDHQIAVFRPSGPGEVRRES